MPEIILSIQELIEMPEKDDASNENKWVEHDINEIEDMLKNVHNPYKRKQILESYIHHHNL